MRDNRSKWLIGTSVVLFIFYLVYKAFFNPGSITDFQNIGGLLFLELMLLILWRFERRFFPVLILIFLAAGTGTPMMALWGSVRWGVLAFGAVAGMAIYLRNYRPSFGLFHLAAIFSFLSALVSTMVSNLPQASAMKVVSLFLLFVYGAGGARIAVLGNEKFMKRILIACEVLIYFTAISYFVFKYPYFGNPNSLGAVMGIIAMPILLWGGLTAETPVLKTRRYVVFLLALFLCLDSYSRASISAALVSCGFLLIGLRRYRMLIQGAAIVGVISILVMTFRPMQSETKSDSVINAFVYKGKPEESLLASRKTPWDETISSIQQNPWLGTGFGTTFSISRPAQDEALRSLAGTSREHGNSYLAITEWVGLLGVIPFVGLILLVLRNVWRGFLQMRRTSNYSQFFIPICAVVVAGLIGAFFEDWLFAAGSYLCVFFWSFAFILPDMLPVSSPAVDPAFVPLRSSWNTEYSVVMPAR